MILAVGQKMPRWVNEACDEYIKRMPSDYEIQIKEIKACARNLGKTVAQMMQEEADRILDAIPQGAHVVALDERGKDLTTVALSDCLKAWSFEHSVVCFVIGGPDGLDKTLKQRADQLMCLSSLTLPHPMVRVVLTEQLYRAWSILTNHPYHRA